MSLVQEILYIASNYPGGYKVLYDILYDSKPPGQSDKSFENSLRNTLSRMKRNGLLGNANREWSVTIEGKEFLEGRNSDIRRFFPCRAEGIIKNTPKSLIIIFDIPEKKRRYRDWLRIQLVEFGFELIQKSVWFGPPLPKEFIEYLAEINLLKYVRFFKASEKDLI